MVVRSETAVRAGECVCAGHAVSQGEFVAAGNPVVVLLPPENLKVRFFVPQEILPKIKTGETVSVSFDGAAKNYSATINYISTQVEFTPPVIYNRENRAKLVFMIEAKFSPADAADFAPASRWM
jgi:HlyD family secretion protein